MTTCDSLRRPATVFVLLFAFCLSSRAQQYRSPLGSQSEPAPAVKLKEKALQQRYFSHPPQSGSGERIGTSSPVGSKAVLERRAELRSRLAQSRGGTALSSTPMELPGFALRPYVPAGLSPAAVVTGDFNKDGHQDFITANGYGNDLWLYLGKGDGTFQLPRVIPLTKGLSPVAIVAADLRHSGNLDLVLAEYDTSTVGVLLGNGDGTFGYEQIFSLPSEPAAVVVDDFNHDGNPDIAVALQQNFGEVYDTVGLIATLFGNGSGSFSNPVITVTNFYSSAWNITSGDVNNDGLPDVLVTGPGMEGSEVWTNNGDGTFAPGQFLGGSGAFNAVLDGRLADLNEDGCLDAAVADANGDVWTAMGDCAGHFTAGPTLQMGDGNSALALVDINHDGHLDVVTTGIPAGDPIYGDLAGDTLSVSFGDGHGNFTLGRNYVGTGVSFSPAEADFNEDGAPDFVTANTSTDSITVYLNDGSGAFGFPQGLFVGLPGVGVLNSPGSGLSFIDVNSDGKPDVALLDIGYNGQPFVTTVINDGTGRFTGPFASPLPTTIGPMNPLGDYRLADFRNSGHPDFIAIGTNFAYSSGASYIVFMPGNGDGTFGAATIATPPGADGAMATGDFDHDGKLDFVAVGRSGTSNLVTLFLGNGDGTFRSAGSASFPDSDNDVGRVFAGDFNRDGNLDVLVFLTGNGYWTTASAAWEFLGDGKGNFSPGQKLFSPFQPFTLADISGDHWPDIVQYDFMWPDGTTQTWGPARFTTYVGQADGTFLQAGTYAPYSGVPRNLSPYVQSGDPAATSLVADLNADGSPDPIAFQTVSPYNYATYAQVLMANGDGTLTPTFDVFPFYKNYSFPKYAHDLDGDGRADLVELDGNTSSMQVFKGSPAPSFQLVLEDERVNGSQGCGWIFPDVADSSSHTVTLSSSIPGVNVPSSVSLPSGSLSQRFCYTLDPSYDWRQVFDLSAQVGTDTAVAYAAQAYVVGFSETLSSSADQVIYAGESTTPITVTVNSSQGYTSTVNLSCAGLPQGASCSFGSNTLAVSPAGPSSTTVIVTTTSAGGGPVTVLASDANVIARQSFLLRALQLSAVMPLGLTTVTSPGSAAADITIYGKPPYTLNCTGLLSGASCAFAGDQLPYPSTTDEELTVSLPNGVAPGSYSFNVNVSGGPQTVSIPATLTVVDFTVQPPATPSWGIPGETAWASATAVGTSGFNGLVNFTCATDFGGSCGDASVGFTGNSPAQFAFQVSIPSGAATGTHTLTLTGSYGSLVHTFSIPFVIADYSGTLDTNSLELRPGSSGSVKATVSVTSGFVDAISLSCTGGVAVSCTFSPATIQPTSGNPQTVTITLAASVSAHARPPHRLGCWGALAAILPLGLFAASFGPRSRRRRLKTAFLVLTVASVAAYTSCGGSSAAGGGGGGGVTAYSVTVKAAAQNTNTTRAIGVVQVNVRH